MTNSLGNVNRRPRLVRSSKSLQRLREPLLAGFELFLRTRNCRDGISLPLSSTGDLGSTPRTLSITGRRNDKFQRPYEFRLLAKVPVSGIPSSAGKVALQVDQRAVNNNRINEAPCGTGQPYCCL